MLKLTRATENPLLTPNPDHDWEKIGAFNPCVIYDNGKYHLLYRALAPKQSYYGIDLELSTVGYAVSDDGINFTERKQLIAPEHDWEFYGCEDPRITKIDDRFYIFYTALSTYPFSASGIRVGVAITKDFQTIEEKHLVTPFNAKAMSLFPEKINGKLTAIVTADTDQPPAKIGIAYFDKIEEIWDSEYWKKWYEYVEDHTLHLQRNEKDHVEIGAPPVKTDQGWLLVYSYIKDYFTPQKIFTIEAITLSLTNPFHVLERTSDALLVPEEKYEREGVVVDIVFPTGALIKDDTLAVFYGGADTVSCLATCSLSALLRDMDPDKKEEKREFESGPVMLERFDENPMLTPIPEHDWEAKAVLNPAAFFEDNKVHIFYRAVSDNDISSIGYAESRDGYHITKRLPDPVLIPRADFEKNSDGKNFGCEDPRMVKIDDMYYMCYTAYDGKNPPRVALTSISQQDVLSEKWNWSEPKIISPPGVDDKDACLFPRKIQGKYVFLHRLHSDIWLDQVDDLEFSEGRVLTGESILKPRADKWDTDKIGIAAPPLETKDGWLLLYHGTDRENRYSIGALMMDSENPKRIIARLDYPIISPETQYEKEGIVPNVVFPCGMVVLEEKLVIYYGAADKVTCAATIPLSTLTDELLRHRV